MRKALSPLTRAFETEDGEKEEEKDENNQMPEETNRDKPSPSVAG